MKTLFRYFALAILIVSVPACFFSGAHVDNRFDEGTFDEELPGLPTENTVVTLNSASNTVNLQFSESQSFFGVAVVAPTSMQGQSFSSLYQMTDPVLELNSTMVNLFFEEGL